ncbi:YchJ family protein [Thiolinea disciformis]|uniref:YchJ family protein n=1 Tax=Thiolinea disciformis TaxID=125614 RepID=UPI0003801231|nr:YchJ family protein [Thiolinea disciformis]
MLCPCQSGQWYNECCRPFHQGKAAPTAELLMRSRYSAYVLGDAAYLHRTWSKHTRPTLKSLMQSHSIQWLGLTIECTEQGGSDDQEGIVEFTARFSENHQEQALHEISRFVRENGRWVYLAGVHQ